MAASDAGRSPDDVGAALARPRPLRWRRRMTEVFRLAARACPAVTPTSVERPAAGDLAAARAASTVNRRPPLRWRRCRFAAMDAGRGRDRGIAWRARNAGAAMPRPAPSVNVADISTNCATEPANFVGRLIVIRSLSRRRGATPTSCRRSRSRAAIVPAARRIAASERREQIFHRIHACAVAHGSPSGRHRTGVRLGADRSASNDGDCRPFRFVRS